MHCWLIRRRLDAYRDGELPPTGRVRVETHLRGCAGCRGELAALGRLRTALAASVPGPPEAVWDTFWPQVRARLAQAPPAPEPLWRRAWTGAARRPALALAPAAAAVSLAILAVLAPWQQAPPRSPAGGPAPAGILPVALDQVVVQSIETADPETPVMVYASPETDMTVLWVFGLERTGT
jgi:anti-sigma factor RsiW